MGTSPRVSPGACSVFVMAGTCPTLCPYDLSNGPTRSRGSRHAGCCPTRDRPANQQPGFWLGWRRRPATVQLKIMVDSYHDRRSGFEFAVNPAGVKRDYAIYNDSQEDDAWDAVWDVATQVDSLGWTAEFAIPLSQLRYVPRPTNTFGFAVWRDIQRYGERVSWPLYRNSQAGITSQLGELTGFEGLPSPRRP